MSNTVIINGVDISSVGAVVANGSYKGLLQFPALKKVDNNSYPDESIRVYDLSNNALEAKTFTMQFYCSINNVDAFIELLTEDVYRVCYFQAVAKTFYLRVVDIKKSGTQKFSELIVTFSDDFPLLDYNQSSIDTTASGLPTLDDVPFSHYSATMLKHTFGNFLTVKENLKQSWLGVHGVDYVDSIMARDVGEVSMDIFISRPIATFWSRYNDLLYVLSKNEAREIQIGSKLYTCHYVSASVSDVYSSGSDIRIKTTLKFIQHKENTVGLSILKAGGDSIVANRSILNVKIDRSVTTNGFTPNND